MVIVEINVYDYLIIIQMIRKYDVLIFDDYREAAG
jgi:hypothetical protein